MAMVQPTKTLTIVPLVVVWKVFVLLLLVVVVGTPIRSEAKNPSSSQESNSIRRLKYEYKKIVQENIAYDWVNQCRIVPKQKKKTKKKMKPKKTNDENKEDHSMIDGNDMDEGKDRNIDVNDGSERQPSEEEEEEEDKEKGEEKDDNEEKEEEEEKEEDRDLCLGPIHGNIYRWNFSFRGYGPTYGQGLYHGQLILPKEFPLKPPRVQLWTPSGRFHTYTDICTSVSSFHPETWKPTLTIPSLVRAVQMHMITSPYEVGGMTSSRERTLEYAKQSWTWTSSAGKKRLSSNIFVDHELLVEQGAITVPTFMKENGEQQTTGNSDTDFTSTDDKSDVHEDDNDNDDESPYENDDEYNTSSSSSSSVASTTKRNHHKSMIDHPNNTLALVLRKAYSSGPVRCIILVLLLYIWFRP